MKLYELDTNFTIKNRSTTPVMNIDTDDQLPSEYCKDRTWCEKGEKGKQIKNDEAKIGKIRKGLR